MSRLTSRERTLATVVGIVAALLLNIFLLNFFLRNQRKLSTELADAAAELEAKKILLAEKAIWEQRDSWLQQKLPTLANEGSGGVQLLDQVKEIAKNHTVLIENPAIGTPDRRAQVLAVTVNIETKSAWPALIAFLRDLQGPEQFVVFETARIQKDTGDATQMRGRFRIGKWFALK